MESARRAKGANNVKQIALAYNQYAFDDVNGRSIPNGTLTETKDAANNIGDWAMVLARKGYLNDPSVYCFSGDSNASKVISKSIANSATETFDTNNNPWDGCAFSVFVATNIPPDAPLSTTPVVCTRDVIFLSMEMQSEDTSDIPQEDLNTMLSGMVLYKSGGCYIGFLDGHVEWFDDFGKDKEHGKLVHYYTRKPTNLINETLPAGCIFLGGTKVKYNGQEGSMAANIPCTAEPES